MSKIDEFAEEFEGEEVDVVEEEVGDAKPEEKTKKKAKIETILTKDQCNDEAAYDAYISYLSSTVPIIQGLDVSKKWTAQEVWAKMTNADKKKANAAFKKKGKFGAGGGGKQATPRTPAEEKAFGIMDRVRKSMIAHAENNFEQELQELQELNPDTPLSIEIYYKGFKKFREGLPQG